MWRWCDEVARGVTSGGRNLFLFLAMKLGVSSLLFLLISSLTLIVSLVTMRGGDCGVKRNNRPTTYNCITLR